jgi:predicted DNA-binding transcriptional regulator YafY
MRLHRLISILLTIENSQKITAKELAAEYETSVRTIYRDIETLCEAGIPIVAEPGPHGGLSLSEGYQTGLKQLNKDEIVYLFLNGMGVKANRSSAIALGVNSSLLKLQKLLAQEEASDVKKRIRHFYVDDSPWWGERNPLQHLDMLMQAIWSSQKLSVQYQKMDQTVSNRILRPYGIVVKDGDWYLIAYCELSSGIRTFKCERISDCSLLPETFDLPDDFSLERYFKTSLESFRSGCQAVEQYPVTLRIQPADAFVLRGCELYSSSVCGEELEVVLNLYSLENALNQFWNVLIKGTVIEPVELIEAVQKCLQDRLSR